MREQIIDRAMTGMQQKTVRQLESVLKDYKEWGKDCREYEGILWNALGQFQGHVFYTAKGLEFFYFIKGNEMFVSRKDKPITRASIMVAFHKALELERNVTGPKKLGTFGASYLYPVFLYLGVINRT